MSVSGLKATEDIAFGRLRGCDVEEWKCVVTKVLLLRRRAAMLSNQIL
jgi:hypothetical protein